MFAEKREDKRRRKMSQAILNLFGKLEPHCVAMAEKGLIPDAVVRAGIRRLLAQRIMLCEQGGSIEAQQEHLEKFIKDVKTRNIAEQTGKANEQHYEVPAELYMNMLGPWLKYSSGYWPSPDCTLQESEEAMLELVCERAELDTLKKGDRVLDLGCGWGSCALYIAKKYPHLDVHCVSNSNSQREFIINKAKGLGLANVTPRTCDINVLQYEPGMFDRIVTNEMFEHMKNYEKLLFTVSQWLKDNGKLFVHIFTHREFTYHFEDGWMAETFFSGGTMPGKDLLNRFNKDLRIEEQWAVNGKHYSNTLEAWLVELDEKADKIRPIFTETYGKGNENKWIFNWRLFNIACSELFRYNDGNEWFVSHYRFVKTK